MVLKNLFQDYTHNAAFSSLQQVYFSIILKAKNAFVVPFVEIKPIYCSEIFTFLWVSSCSVVVFALPFHETEARHDTPTQTHTKNLIKVRLGESGSHFKSIMNANLRLVAPPPTTQTTSLGFQKSPLTTCWASSFTVLTR